MIARREREGGGGSHTDIAQTDSDSQREGGREGGREGEREREREREMEGATGIY